MFLIVLATFIPAGTQPLRFALRSRVKQLGCRPSADLARVLSRGWQLSYRLAKPLPLKAGTQLKAVAWYDNSWKNPHNPNHDATVRWGDQTYDEMMVGFFDVAIPADMDKAHYFIRQTGNPGASADPAH